MRLTLAQAATRGCFSVLVVVVAIDVLGVGDAGVGVLTAAVGAGAVIGSLAMSLFADGRRLAAVLGVGVALWGLPLAVVGAIPREAVILPMLAAVGVGNAHGRRRDLHPAATAGARRACSLGCSGRWRAWLRSSSRGACLLTPVLLDVVGIRWTLIVVGSLGPVYVAVAWTRLRAIDRTVTRRDLEIGLLDELPMFRPLAMPAIEQLADRLERADGRAPATTS